MIGLVEPNGGTPLYQLKITLRWSKPAIWRRVKVRADMKLDRLHDVIQWVMPWTNSHLHQFIVGETYYGQPEGDFESMSDYKTLDEKKHTLADIAPAAKAIFIYEYDFGDGWEHAVRVEKVLPPEAGFKHPVCLAGANACPPDDCGGIPGYYHLLEVLGNRKHPDHKELKEWLGVKWDATAFDLDGTNQMLSRMKA